MICFMIETFINGSLHDFIKRNLYMYVYFLCVNLPLQMKVNFHSVVLFLCLNNLLFIKAVKSISLQPTCIQKNL